MADSDEKKIQMPPADFSTLMISLGTSVQLNLGLLKDPEEKDNFPVNFKQAKYTIDLIAMLEEKTKGNLSAEEIKLLENLLHELRMAYVEKTGQK